MCGRYTNAAKKDQIRKEFSAKIPNAVSDKPRYNIAPSQMIEVVLNDNTERIVSLLKWGLIPHWAKDAEIGNKLINARGETLSEKPSFRDAFKNRRCIIPATGFYEWKKGRDGKQPYYFHLKEKDVFGFAGLWEEWIDKETNKVIETCTIITTEANEVLKPVHDRMPVILKAEDYDEWLDTTIKKAENLQKFLAPYSANEMESYSVSKSVNVPDSDSKELIKPLNSL